jgi:hypothetical protein
MAKRQPWSTCRDCGFDPERREEDLVRSVYLSIGRFDEDDERKRYRTKLDEVGQAIRRGEQPAFDEAELERLRAQKAAVEAVPPSAAWNAVLWFFLPGIGVLLVLVAMLIALKALK